MRSSSGASASSRPPTVSAEPSGHRAARSSRNWASAAPPAPVRSTRRSRWPSPVGEHHGRHAACTRTAACSRSSAGTSGQPPPRPVRRHVPAQRGCLGGCEHDRQRPLDRRDRDQLREGERSEEERQGDARERGSPKRVAGDHGLLPVPAVDERSRGELEEDVRNPARETRDACPGGRTAQTRARAADRRPTTTVIRSVRASARSKAARSRGWCITAPSSPA